MSITDIPKSGRTARGFSFIELIIFIVIISIAVAGILMVMNYTTAHSADAQLRKQALAIAESLLEEVELARFTYCNPSDPQAPFATQATGPGVIGPQPPGSSKTQGYCTSAALVENFAPVSGSRPYGNVINYASKLNTPFTINPVTDSNGNAILGLVGTGTYSATITISQPAGVFGGATNAMPADSGVNATIGSVLQISVTVYQGGSAILTLDGYRTQYAPQLMP
jgi:MSHA pilin protein MshD